MPRFFFHLYDDIVARDEEGVELADIEAARRTAMFGVRAMICDQVTKGHLHLDHRLEVEDEDGKRVFDLQFGDAIEIEPSSEVRGT